MKVYKFGGASVKNGDGVRNLHRIICDEQNLFIVVSAMGKTTNGLERVFDAVKRGNKAEAAQQIDQIEAYHTSIVDDLFHGENTNIESIARLFAQLRDLVDSIAYSRDEAELWYDSIVAFGELLSTRIVSEYLNSVGVSNQWVDMRQCIITELRHRDASVDMALSEIALRKEVECSSKNIFIGQGFIGGAPDGSTTTLGREGSDYSAAVVANILDAESMSVWKDVDGILNADPKRFPDAVQIKELSYLDTIELAYSGAQIIHPKTIKPLQNKNIPLYVRPFGDKRKPGTVIRASSAQVAVPILILKGEQVLLTMRSRDFSFVLEEKFATIFATLERFRIKSNLVHNSAISLGVCVDEAWHLDDAVEALRSEGFDVMAIRDMELLTIRGYNDQLYQKYAVSQKVFIRQSTQSTIRIVRKK